MAVMEQKDGWKKYGFPNVRMMDAATPFRALLLALAERYAATGRVLDLDASLEWSTMSSISYARSDITWRMKIFDDRLFFILGEYIKDPNESQYEKKFFSRNGVFAELGESEITPSTLDGKLNADWCAQRMRVLNLLTITRPPVFFTYRTRSAKAETADMARTKMVSLPWKESPANYPTHISDNQEILQYYLSVDQDDSFPYYYIVSESCPRAEILSSVVSAFDSAPAFEISATMRRGIFNYHDWGGGYLENVPFKIKKTSWNIFSYFDFSTTPPADSNYSNSLYLLNFFADFSKVFKFKDI